MSLSAEQKVLRQALRGEDEAKVSGLDSDSVAQLQEAFRLFNEASARFSDQYARLEGRIAELNVELEEANERLRRNLKEKERVQNYLSTLLESLPVGVVGVDACGRVSSCNRCACEILDLPKGPSEGPPLRALIEALGAVVEGAGEIEELERRLADPARAGQDALEAVVERAADQRRRVLRLRVAPAGGGEAQARVVLVEDVTDVRRLEQQASRNNRLTAMGEIAMNVAHEIRNPLGSIELFASMLERDLADDPERRNLASHICTGVRCADHIVSNILQFSRPQRLSCTAFNLCDLLDETLVFAEHALRQKGIEVARDYRRPQAAVVWADAELFKQMMLNLFLNAIQATPESGSIGVTSIPNGRSVELRVWDSGCGFPKENLPRIFDPFFTTRRKGTGLGLTIVHNIVSAHHGSIEACNRPEGGAQFSIVLPKRAPAGVDGREIAPALFIHPPTEGELRINPSEEAVQ